MLKYNDLLKLLNNIPTSSNGAISISSSPKTKFYKIHQSILCHTKFLNKYEWVTFKDRIFYVRNNFTKIRKCSCGCGRILKNIKSKYIRGHSNRVQTIKDKKIQTCLKNYGTFNPSQNQIIKDKKIQTCLKNYGTEHPTQNKIILNKQKSTCFKNHGTDNYSKSKKFSNKMKTYWKNDAYKIDNSEKIKTQELKKFYSRLEDRLSNLYDILFTDQEYKGVSHKYKFRCRKCKSIVISDLDDGKIPRCTICNPYITAKGHSKLEYDVELFLRTLNIVLETGSRKIIPPLELDFYIPDKNIAIEFNGIYWHSELQGKDKNYHLNKTNLCKAKGIQLIHISENDWLYKQQYIKGYLKHILNSNKYSIKSNDCIVKEIDNLVKTKFLNKYHIKNDTKTNINIGAFYKNRLVSVMSFIGNNDYELKYATINNFETDNIPILLKYFEDNYKHNSIFVINDKQYISYDYSQLGFNLKRTTNPIKNEITKIWDCGNEIFEKRSIL